jgi:hypothetical protein
MPADLERELGSALAALTLAEVAARELRAELDRHERFVVNLEQYVRNVHGLPSKAEWDVIRDVLGDALRGDLDD